MIDVNFKFRVEDDYFDYVVFNIVRNIILSPSDSEIKQLNKTSQLNHGIVVTRRVSDRLKLDMNDLIKFLSINVNYFVLFRRNILV